MNEELLFRFLTKQCTPEEKKRIESWLSESRENADFLFEMERIWYLREEIKYSDKKIIDKAYRSFINRIEEKEEYRKQENKQHSLIMQLRAAAAIIVVMILGVNLYYFTSRNVDTTAMNTISVPAGQRINITLSDGTNIWLNACTNFSYPVSFNKNERRVTLNGGAYFNVTTDKEHPFIVDANGYEIKALGTEFDVDAYSGTDFETNLFSGSVNVSNNKNESITIKPNERVFLNKEGVLKKGKVEYKDKHKWIEGLICFKNKSFENMMNDFEKY